MFITDSVDHTPIVAFSDIVPSAGTYLSSMTSVSLRQVNELPEQISFCLVIEHELVHVETLEKYSFTETFCRFIDNHRSEKFFTYLKNNFPSLEQYDELDGTREKLEITWDIVGGFVYPVVQERTLLAKSPLYIELYESVHGIF